MNYKADWLHFGAPVVTAALSEALNALSGSNALSWQAITRAVIMAALSALVLALKTPPPVTPEQALKTLQAVPPAVP
jgi:hypothetical protein